jgi:hypothetical protein
MLPRADHIAAALLLLLLPAANVRGQDDIDEEVEVEVLNNHAAGLAFIQQQQQPNPDQFEQWVYNRSGGAGIARNRLNATLDLHIDEVCRVCRITPEQKKKLQVAGRGDIKRFFDRVDEAKRRYMRVMNDPNHNIWEDVQPLQAILGRGLFGDDSIFSKTVKSTLTDEQAAKLSALQEHRRTTRYRATLDWFVAHVDKALGMTALQRKRFTELILAETRPPRRLGQSDYYLLMYQASQVSEDKMKPIFDAMQWRVLSGSLNQGRGMKQWLKANGVIDDEPAGGAGGKDRVEAARPALKGR